MRFGIYIHIPYCIQRCRYCDFTTFEQNSILPPIEYIEYVKKEIRTRSSLHPKGVLTSIYFGGGTPSLIEAGLIVDLLSELANNGFEINEQTEVTIEINPATVSEDKLSTYLKAGINRFSVGAQTFDDDLLKLCGREHSAKDTLETLALLKSYNVNFTADILFALPSQTLSTVERDTLKLLEYSPNHISAYCLTVPANHPMSHGRAPEEEQTQMFDVILKLLNQQGFNRYEISNFAKPGYESKHNSIYWSNDSFWGLGLSAHSYSPNLGRYGYGIRYWNPKKFNEYFSYLETTDSIFNENPQFNEHLKVHEALTDYCHMFLRTLNGINLDAMQNKFAPYFSIIKQRLDDLISRNLLVENLRHICLTTEGVMISNKVFESLTFLESDLASSDSTHIDKL